MGSSAESGRRLDFVEVRQFDPLVGGARLLLDVVQKALHRRSGGVSVGR